VRAGHRKLAVLAGEKANAFVHSEGAECFSNRDTWAPTLREFGAPNDFVGLDGEPHRLLRKTFASHFSRKAAETRLPALIDLSLRAFAECSSEDEIPFVALSQALTSRQVGTMLVGRVPSRVEHEAILRYTNGALPRESSYPLDCYRSSRAWTPWARQMSSSSTSSSAFPNCSSG
jgi:cytochrome P450